MKIHYLQIEPSEKGTHANESIMVKLLSAQIRQMSKVHLMGYRVLLFARLLAF